MFINNARSQHFGRVCLHAKKKKKNSDSFMIYALMHASSFDRSACIWRYGPGHTGIRSVFHSAAIAVPSPVVMYPGVLSSVKPENKLYILIEDIGWNVNISSYIDLCLPSLPSEWQLRIARHKRSERRSTIMIINYITKK